MKPFQILDSQIKGWKSIIKQLEHPYFSYFLMRFIAHPKLFYETDANKDNRYGFMKAGGGYATPRELIAQKYMIKAFLESAGEARTADLNNEPVIWFDWPAPVEILKAFNVAYFCQSFFMFASQSKGGRGVIEQIDACEDERITSDLCSMTRISFGAYLTEQIPRPSAIIGTAHPCDSARSVNQLYDYYTGVPTFTLDTPYGRDEDSLNHYAENVWEMIRFLENHLGKKINWDKLKSVIEEVNKYNYYFREVTMMHRAIPSPGLVLPEIISWITNIFASGSKNLTAMAKIYYEISKRRIKKPNFLRARKEKIRVLICDTTVVFTELFSWMKKEFGAVVVGDYVGDRINPEIDTSTHESMVKGIAADKLYMGMIRQAHGPIEFTTEELTRNIENFSADCVIFNGHISCKFNSSSQKIIKDTCKKAGVPALFMEVDIYDQRVVPEKEMQRQIKEFFVTNGLI